MTSPPPAVGGGQAIVLKENKGADYRLSPGQISALSRTDAVRFTALGGDQYRVTASLHVVGSAVFGTGPDAVPVRIRPKVRIGRLLFMLSYAQDKVTWQDSEVDAVEAEDLLPAIADVFARAARRALNSGLLYGYRTVEDDLVMVRGRIRSDEMRRRHWVGPAVPCEYDDFTADILENRLLLAAVKHLLRLPGVMSSTRRALRDIAAELVDVTPLGPGDHPPFWPPTAYTGPYRMALRLADLVVQGRSYEYLDEAGANAALQVDGYLVKMWTVFEAFVTRAVRDALEHSPDGRIPGRRVNLQDKTHHLDSNNKVLLKPDLVCYQATAGGRHEPIAVLDAKYKIEKDADGPETIYQLFVYCVALGLRAGHVVYAGEPGEGPHTHVLATGIEITFHPLDLAAPIDDLRRQITNIAADMTAASTSTPR